MDSALAATTWKKFLFESTYEGFKALTGKDLSALPGRTEVDAEVGNAKYRYPTGSVELIRDLHLQNVRFAPDKSQISRQSEHLNISINVPKGSESVRASFGGMGTQIREMLENTPKKITNITPQLGDALVDTYQKYLGRDLLLIYNGPSSLGRWTPTSVKADRKKNSSRVELKAPDCASNSYLNALLGIAYTYAAMTSAGITKAGEHSWYSPNSLATNLCQKYGNPVLTSNYALDPMKNNFTNGSIVLKVMDEVARKNNIDPSVVEDFKKALIQRAEYLDKNPPGRIAAKSM